MESSAKPRRNMATASFRKPYGGFAPPRSVGETGPRVVRSTRFTLGDWTVRPALGLIEREGMRSSLEPRLLDVLGYLAERKGEVVTIDELLDACWSGAFYGDNPVHKAIAMLRKALGDDARAPRYVATIRKRGYRILAPVCFDDTDTPTDPPHPSPPPGLGDLEVVAALANRWYAGGRRPEDLLPLGSLLEDVAALADDQGTMLSREHARFVRRSRRQAVVRSCTLACMVFTILSLTVCILLSMLERHGSTMPMGITQESADATSTR